MANAEFTMVRCATPGVEAVAASSRRSFSRHSHDQFGIGAIDVGAHRSQSGRGQVEAEAGDAITVNPGEVHDGAPIGDEERSWRILYFEPALVLDSASDVFEHRSGEFELRAPVIGDRRVTHLFRLLFGTETNGAVESIRREELLLALLAQVGRYQARCVYEAPPQVRLARARIDDDPAAQVTLAELAQISGMSRFQLLRAFHRATRLTPHAYLVQRRIDLARRLIKGGLALAEVAAAAGFADQSHLTRTFVARFGVSPGSYARAHLHPPGSAAIPFKTAERNGASSLL